MNDFEISSDPSLSVVFEDMARTFPDKVALRFGDRTLTYQTLNEQANQLARLLIDAGVQPGHRVGLLVDRSPELVISFLAILKTGAAYVPVDPQFPADRIAFMLTDSGCVLLLTNERHAQKTGLPIQEILLETAWPLLTRFATNNLPPATTGKSLLYVLYTSGTTGKPKGVLTTHRGVLNVVRSLQQEPGFTAVDKTVALATITFDLATIELYLPLLTGAEVVLVDTETARNGQVLSELLQTEAITFVQATPSTWRMLSEAGWRGNPALTVISCAEALPLDLARTLLADCRSVWNFYGPTETTVYATGTRIWPDDTHITIGKAIRNTVVFITDEALNPLPDGELGELCIGGDGLANGYLNQTELTTEKFTVLTLPDGSQQRVYRTGDLGCFLPDGTIDYRGRRDDQVKIRGHRIELGEVERTIGQLPDIGQAVVVALDDTIGQKQLVAYLVASAGHEQNTRSVRERIGQQLPAVMMPAVFVWLDRLPINANGKVDKKQLPAPERNRLSASESAVLGAFQKPKTLLEKTIAAIWSELLAFDQIGLTDNFFELGGNSLLAQRMVSALQQAGYTLPITKLYQFPTITGISEALDRAGVPVKSEELRIKKSVEADKLFTLHSSLFPQIAIIGMAGRFPGANTLAELWDVLKAGRETVRFFTDAELDSSVSESRRKDPLYVKARGIINGADEFDPAFFGMTPNQARLMDPQQRVFLEIAYETLEQTGYLPQHFGGRVGVFAGTGTNTYYLNNVLPNRELVDGTIGAFQTELLNEKDYVATRTAYALNLTGPAVSVFSACSTSLLAVAQAVQSLRSGQCDVALAGGASITAPINSGHLYQEGAMLSRDGHTRSFSAGSTGTVFSDGAGVVLLKPLEAAQRDGDTVWAVIKGIGISNDGGGKGSFMAPSAEGQAAAISMALADAQVDPATIGYEEAHGTATPIGDPIEIEGLTMAFGEQTEQQFCAIGSIKSNFGHLTAAAGVAGLIKTTLALHHRQLPPSVGFDVPNPAIDFASSPFFVNNRLREFTTPNPLLKQEGALPPGAKAEGFLAPSLFSRRGLGVVNSLRAGVSSFGVGGTNVHVILEEVPNVKPQTPNVKPQTTLITWSAKTATSAANYTHRLADTMRADDAPALAEVAYTLQTTRPSYAFRQFIVAGTTDELLNKLAVAANPETLKMSQPPGEIVFLFPGQGAQYLNMARPFYENEPVFRQAIDDCAALLTSFLDTDIRAVLYPERVNTESDNQQVTQHAARLNDTRYTQPVLFTVEYALARFWMSQGIVPSVLCGHSIGEFVAAHLAGVFSLADALTIVATRGRLVSEQPSGSMLSVRANAETIRTMLPYTLGLAAVNSKNLCVVSGPDEAVADFAALLTNRDIPNKRLPTSHAFHSAMMEPVAGVLAQVMASIVLNRPRKPIISTLTGTFLTDAQATDPQYWARHLRETVQFATALDTIFTLDNPLLFDVGPGRVSATLARQQASGRVVSVLTGLDPATDTDWAAAQRAMLTTLGQLWQQGINPDWSALYPTETTPEQRPNRVILPAYCFDNQRHWVEPPTVTMPTINPAMLPNNAPTVLSETTLSSSTMRKPVLLTRINELLESASGFDVAGLPPTMNFLEMGFDSLLLTQLATTVKREFAVPITFRQLATDLQTPDNLAAYLDQTLPADQFRPAPVVVALTHAHATNGQQPTLNGSATPNTAPAYPPLSVPNGDSALGLIAQQLQLLARQVALLQGDSQQSLVIRHSSSSPGQQSLVNDQPPMTNDPMTNDERTELKKPFGATARIDRQITAELTDRQRQFLQELTARYNQKTAGSKAYTGQHRPQMADPRVVSGFRPLTKEVVYPIVVNRSRGSRLWDVDGNEYIDVLNGFGSNLFGYQPDHIREALHDQIEAGFEVGPQHELAGRVTELICDMTNSDRAALCSTGSEAVLGAMRVARTVTGRSLIVAFTGSYHGINDEVIVRGTKKLKSFPAAAGIMPEAVQNMLILDYGTDESLRIIRERAAELAAVLVEPVQSRRADFLPTTFLHDLRAITASSGTALIFDEVITGFRMHIGGMQAILNIRADLVTYGKVVGAGLPIGVIAGKRAFMDALDGGTWQFGNDSVPEIGVTYFAGTFVRHPLALAAALASLTYIKQHSPHLQNDLNAKTNRLVGAMNDWCTARQVPIVVAHYGSLWKLKFTEERPYSELLFTLMREKGIHIWDGFPCFITEALTDTDLDAVLTAFTGSLTALTDAGFMRATLPTTASTAATDPIIRADVPPVPGARLGRDKRGNPAWFVPSNEQPGVFLQLGSSSK